MRTNIHFNPFRNKGTAQEYLSFIEGFNNESKRDK